MKRKILSSFLALSFILSMMSSIAFAANTNTSQLKYTDVQNHWAQTAIEKWSNLGIIQGYNGSFRPDDSITRGEMAVIIDRIMQYKTSANNSFSDLGQAFYTASILKANAAGVILGDKKTIRPTDAITREEAVVMISRALGLTASASTSVSFSDSANISSWALGYVNSMANKRYLQGTNGKFNPKSLIKRAEIVTILNNAIAKLGSTTTAEYTGDVTGTVVVNTSSATLSNMKITGDLIIAEGVGNGDVTLKNVTVTGNTIIRGGGANSIHITGNSNLAAISIEKTAGGAIRVVTSDKSVVNSVYINDGSDDVILTGSFNSVTVAAKVAVQAVNATIQTVAVAMQDASLNLDAGTKVNTLILDTKATITNNGTISKAEVKANDVKINGNEPTKVNVGSNVTNGPTDNSGKKVDGQSTGTTGGGGSLTIAVSAITCSTCWVW